jgi:hypothetical protein
MFGSTFSKVEKVEKVEKVDKCVHTLETYYVEIVL